MRYKDEVLKHYPDARAVVVSHDPQGAPLRVLIYSCDLRLSHYGPRPNVRQSHATAWRVAYDWIRWGTTNGMRKLR